MKNLDLQYLKKKYNNTIVIGRKKYIEIIDYMENRKIDKVELSEKDIPVPFLKMIRYNSINCNEYCKQNLKEKDLEITAFNILNNNNNVKYFQTMRDYKFEDPNNKTIILVVEKNTGTIFSNCEKLQLELFIQYGLDLYDYDNDTTILHAYLINLDKYMNYYNTNPRQ